MSADSPARVAIVTGAAQGIGRAIALRLAADGLAVAVNDIASKKAEIDEVVALIQEKNVRGLAVPADVSQEEEVRGMVDAVVAHFGRLDVMVANAGVVLLDHERDSSSFLQADIKAWERVWDINVRGVVLSYKYAAIQMVKQGHGGRIIGASSLAGKKGFQMCGAYCASKFAVRGLTQVAAQELNQHGITVNAYAPGFIATPMTLLPTDEQFGGPVGTFKTFVNLGHTKTGQPEVVASLVSYLALPESHFITGQTIIVDGGILFD